MSAFNLSEEDSEVIANVRNALYDWGLGDIYKSLGKVLGEDRIQRGTTFDEEKAALRGAFILGCSLIDAMTCYRYGSRSDPSTFKKFCQEYMPAYIDGDSNALWYALRCGLIHNYVPRHTELGSKKKTNTEFALTHQNPDSHLQEKDGMKIINLENFIDDIESVLLKILGEFEGGGDPLIKLKQWAEHGVMTKPEATKIASGDTLVPSASAVYYKFRKAQE